MFDAAHVEEQRDLLVTLQRSGCEIVLDPNVAETAMPGRFDSSVSELPWGNPDRPWQPSDFGRARNLDTAKAIAEFAVRHKVDAVLAPTHCIDTFPSLWLPIDLRLCDELRNELDRAGGKQVSIDFQIITTNTLLKDSPVRETLVASASRVPVENIWLRASGFGAAATGSGTRAFIEAVRNFHEAEKPIIADYAGGFAALAVAAFGGVGGICHGMGQKESFRMGDWKRPTTGGGGSAKRVYIPELDRSFKKEQIDALFAVKGTRARCGCNDTTCCVHGTEDMIENPNRHFVIQRSRQIKSLSDVSEARRAEHFLLHHLDPAVRSARLASRLKFSNDGIAKLIDETKKRLTNLRDPLGDLHSNSALATRSTPPRFRGEDQKFQSAVG